MDRPRLKAQNVEFKLERLFKPEEVREIYQKFLELRISESKKLLRTVKVCECEQAGGYGCTCEDHMKFQRPYAESDSGSSTSSLCSPTNNVSSEEVFSAMLPSTSVTREQDNVPKSTMPPAQPTSQDHLDVKKKSFVPPAPGVTDSTNPSGRSSPSSESESSGISISSTTPFDRYIFTRSDSISCHVTNGYLLLISNMWDLQHPEPRIGTKEDSDEVEKFFKRAGFKVNKLDNQSKKDMEKQFQDLAWTEELCDYDCFALVIMSHGGEKGIYGSCGEPYDVNKIIDLFKGDSCPALLTKPKLFFIQACRGNKTDKGCDNIRRDGPAGKSEPPTIRIPTDSDILVAYSTTEGRPAYRDVDWSDGRPTGGSWFISCMMQVFHAYGDREDLMTMMVRVNRAISKYGENDKQVPCQVSMLTKKIYFTFETL